MTNWLDPEEVKAQVAKAVGTEGKWSHAATTDYHRLNAWSVLEALASLPEPPNKRHIDEGVGICEHCDLRRIRHIARIIVGKDGP